MPYWGNLSTFAMMIHLDRHIEILLLSNDCVIVPSLGGFMTHYVDARYDETDHEFLPPLRSIGFNQKLTLNDSLLAQSYVEAYDISYPDAVMRIEDEVRELKQHLEHDGTFELNDLGVLRLNEDGNIEFEPCEAGILTPELYGLADFEMVPLASLIASTSSMTKGADQPTAGRPMPLSTSTSSGRTLNVNISPSPSTEGDAPAAGTTTDTVRQDENQEDGTVRIRISLIRNVAVACIAFLVFFLLPSPLGNDKLAPKQSSIDTGLLLKILPKDDTSGTQSVKEAVKSEMKSKAAGNIVRQSADVKSQPAAEQEPAYTVVLASRITRQNAQEYVEHLHQKGYSEVEMLVRKSGVKVIYGRYTTEEEARRVLNRLNDNKDFAGVWIMKYPAEE